MDPEMIKAIAAIARIEAKLDVSLSQGLDRETRLRRIEDGSARVRGVLWTLSGLVGLLGLSRIMDVLRSL